MAQLQHSSMRTENLSSDDGGIHDGAGTHLHALYL